MTLLDDYVQWLLHLPWGPTYWIPIIVISCVGIILTGFAFGLWRDEHLPIGVIPVVGLAITAIVAWAWPLLAIGAPFLAIAGCLFWAGLRAHDKLVG